MSITYTARGKKLLDKVFEDTSVPVSATIARLESLRVHINELLEALHEMEKLERGA